MSKTRDKILGTALRLFNEAGLAHVSQRRITDELKISPGNLTYHFKRKEDIEEALYFELVDKVDRLLEGMKGQRTDLALLLYFSEKMFGAFLEYRFVFLDIVSLMRNNKKIEQHYQALQKVRKAQFMQIIHDLIEGGWLREEALTNEYLYLYGRTQVFSDFYLSSVEVSQQGLSGDEQSKFQDHLKYALYPYLTEKGRQVLW